MIQDLTLFTKHEYLPWQQLRYGPHVGDLHVVAETCSSPHLAESLFPPAEGAHSCSCFGHGSAGGVGGHPACLQQGAANCFVRYLLAISTAALRIGKTRDDRITDKKRAFASDLPFQRRGGKSFPKVSLLQPLFLPTPPASLPIAPRT